MKKTHLCSLAILLALALPLQAQTNESYTFNVGEIIPDGNPTGLVDVQMITSAITLLDSVEVRLTIAGTFNGDLYVTLAHESGFSVLLNRTGRTASDAFGYSDDGFNITLAGSAANGDVHVYRTAGTPNPGSPLIGTWQPDARNVDPDSVTDGSARTAFLSSFNDLDANGQWRLFVADVSTGEVHTLTSWGLDLMGIPEPATISLALVGLVALAYAVRRARSQA